MAAVESKRLAVVCGELKADFLLDAFMILYNGETMSPTQFEKLAGKGSAKKWKHSVKVVTDNGATVRIGIWLEDRDIEVPGSRGVRILRPRTTEVAEQDLLGHFERQNIGHRTGDATALPLPNSVQGVDVSLPTYNLATMSDGDLKALCNASQCGVNPLRDLLDHQPGVKVKRQGHFTGFTPPTRPASPGTNGAGPGSENYVSNMDAFLENQISALPDAERLAVGGQHLDVHRLWRSVQERGGLSACDSNEQWTHLARDLGCSAADGPHVIRSYYQKHLLPKERSHSQAATVQAAVFAPTATLEQQPGGVVPLSIKNHISQGLVPSFLAKI